MFPDHHFSLTARTKHTSVFMAVVKQRPELNGKETRS